MKVVFKNQPKLSGFDIDKRADDLRVSLIPHIESFLKNDELFSGKEISVEFSHVGVSSLLSFIETEGKKYVLKIPLFDSNLAGNEAMFLKAWKNVDVSVPHVYKTGVIDGHQFLLMEFVDAPVLMDVIEKGEAKENVSIELGKILAKMHTSKAEGFGQIVDGKPEFKTFQEWVSNKPIQERIEYVKNNNVLGDEHGSIDKAIDILTTYAEKQNSSTYCHFDFGASNILATEPLTVIDPNPIFNLGIVDIGRSVLLEHSGGFDGEQLKQGYFSGAEYDAQALQSAVLLSAYWKVVYWHQKNKTKPIENVRQFLSKTKHLLEYY